MGQEFCQSSTVPTEADDANRRAVQIGSGPPNKLLLLGGAKKTGRLSHQSQQEGQGLLGNLIGKQPGSTGYPDGRIHDFGGQTVVETRGGRLDPFQTALSDHAIPGYRAFFSVSAEDISGHDVLGDRLLCGFNDFGVRCRISDLLYVSVFGLVAENNAHGVLLRWQSVSDSDGSEIGWSICPSQTICCGRGVGDICQLFLSIPVKVKPSVAAAE